MRPGTQLRAVRLAALGLLAVLACSRVWAVASVIQEGVPPGLNFGTTITSTAYAANATIGAAEECLMASAATSIADLPSTVIDSAAQTYTFRKAVYDATDSTVMAAYTLASNTSATKLTCTLTWGASHNFAFAWMREIGTVVGSSVQVQGQFQNNPGTGANAISSGTITPSAQPAFMSAISYNSSGNDTVSITAGTGFTTGFCAIFPASACIGVTESQRFTSLSAVAGTFTDATDGAANPYLTIALLYSEVGAGGGAVPHPGVFVTLP